jgi:hypothetical protein
MQLLLKLKVIFLPLNWNNSKNTNKIRYLPGIGKGRGKLISTAKYKRTKYRHLIVLAIFIA